MSWIDVGSLIKLRSNGGWIIAVLEANESVSGEESGVVQLFILGGFYLLEGFWEGSFLKMVESKKCVNGWVIWILILKVLEDEVGFFQLACIEEGNGLVEKKRGGASSEFNGFMKVLGGCLGFIEFPKN